MVLEPLNLWIGLIIGVLFHTAADSIKRARTLGTTSATGLAIGRVTAWIDAHRNLLCLRLVAMAIGAIGAFVVLDGQLAREPGSTIFTMFLVGYGLDSFVDMFFETVGQRAAAQTAALKKQLGASAET